MSASNPLPKINQFNSPERPHINKPWTWLRWNYLSPMPKVAGETPSLMTLGAPGDPRQTWGMAVTYFTKTLWRLPCENRCARVSGGIWWLQQGSENQKPAAAGAGSCSAPSLCTPRACSSRWRQHHEQNHILLPTLFPATVNFKQNQILFNKESLLFLLLLAGFSL